MALDFFAGCLGGCAGILVGYPFDTVKVHLQTQDFRNPKYRGTFHCFQSIIQKETVCGLYRGISSPLAAVAAINAILFGVYGNAQRHMSDPDSLSSHALAGAVAGLVQSFVCSPVELAKTRAQVHAAPPLRCLVDVARSGGARAVFKGLGVTVVREVPAFSVYFFTYEAMTRGVDRPSAPHMLLAGGLSGCASWLTSYPADVVKSRLQADTLGRYTGAVDCFRRSVAEEGLRVLTRGLASTLLRAFPTNAATFAVVTWVMRGWPASAGDCGSYHTPLRAGEFVTLGAPQLERQVSSRWTSSSRRLPAPQVAYYCESRLEGEEEEQVRAVLLGCDDVCPCSQSEAQISSPNVCCCVCSEPRVLAAGDGHCLLGKYIQHPQINTEIE